MERAFSVCEEENSSEKGFVPEHLTERLVSSHLFLQPKEMS